MLLAEIVWRPIASPLSILGGAALLMGLAAFAYVRTGGASALVRGSLLVMRLAVIAAIAVFLLGPSGAPPAPSQTQRPRLQILLDTSESMQVDDCQGISRLGFVREHWLSDDRLRRLSADFDVELTGFDEKPRSLSREALRQEVGELASGRETRLSESVLQTVSRFPARDDGSALLVLSDGHDTADSPIQPAASLARSKGLPVHTVVIGSAQSRPDITLVAVPMQDYLLPNESGAILVKVHQTGLDEAQVTLRMRQGGDTSETPIPFQGRPVVEVKLPVQQASPGQYEYFLEVDALPSEVERSNNAQQVFLEVQEKRLKVLVLEGQPFWDSKFLTQSLRKDQRLELTQITQVSRRKRETIVTRADQGPAVVPDSDDAWAAYDAVILGRGLESLLNARAAEQLTRYVSQGGSLIFSRGRPYAPDSAAGRQVAPKLAAVEPVRWGEGVLRDMELSLTPAGQASPWFAPTKMGVDAPAAIARLPGFAAMSEVRERKPGAIILAEAAAVGSLGGGEAQPAIVTMRYGRGSVAAILGEGLWRWSLLSPDQQDLAGFYDTFWSNLVRWMVGGGDFQPGDQVALLLSRASARKGDSLHIDVAYKTLAIAPHHRLELVEPSGERREIALARLPGPTPRFRAEVDPRHVGVYEAVLHAPGATPSQQRRKFNVYDLNLERFETAARPAPLRTLSEHSGGEFFEATDADRLAHVLRGRRLAAVAPPRLEYLWDQGLLMGLMLTWAGVEWLLRRMAGML